MTQILGTDKYVVSFYNAKMVRGGKVKPEHFVYKQWGRVQRIDKNGKVIDEIPFSEYGAMLTFMTTNLRKKVIKNLKEHTKKEVDKPVKLLRRK